MSQRQASRTVLGKKGKKHEEVVMVIYSWRIFSNYIFLSINGSYL
ncbi:hypothetical protein XNW1_4040002 [Xenorhabdus nematophila str. Websteri]|nr:hypothetical protein XNW1_4040002 [Xenorhabdus nematophila str. Websteri]